MIRFEASTNLKNPIKGTCTQIVIYDENNNPVTIVIQLGPDQYITTHIGDEDFDNWVKLVKCSEDISFE